MKPAPSRRAAEPASLGVTEHPKLTPTTFRTQHTQQLGDATRRIVARLDRRRSRTMGVPKPKTKRKTKLTPEEQRKAAFHDPRQMQLPFNHQSKDNSDEKN